MAAVFSLVGARQLGALTVGPGHSLCSAALIALFGVGADLNHLCA